MESTELPNCLKSEKERKMLIIIDEQFNKKKNQPTFATIYQRYAVFSFFFFNDDFHVRDTSEKKKKKNMASFSTDFLYISNEQSYFKSIYLELNFKAV